MGLSYFGTVEPIDCTLRADEDPALTDSGTFAPVAHRPDELGRERYLLEGEIARGGHATILRAQDRRLRRPVAIKQLRERGPLADERFVAEALITARLAHPSIVPIFDIGNWPDGTPYFAMKLVRGATLKSRILTAADETSRLELLSVVADVADAVAYAHSEGIVHCDLKPSNVLVCDFGQTVVIDWGIARPLDQRPSNALPGLAIQTGGIAGTPGFMSPEQARGTGVDERTDVYSIGAILFAVLAGSPPFAGYGPAQTVDELRRGAPPPNLRQRAPWVGKRLRRIVERAMASNPAERFGSVPSFLASLRPELERRLSRAG